MTTICRTGTVIKILLGVRTGWVARVPSISHHSEEYTRLDNSKVQTVGRCVQVGLGSKGWVVAKGLLLLLFHH